MESNDTPHGSKSHLFLLWNFLPKFMTFFKQKDYLEIYFKKYSPISFLLKLNASATTFCRLFSTATFWRPKLAWRLFAVLFSGKGLQKVANLFCPPKGCQKDTKKMPKGQQPFLDAKRFPSKKVGKKSWHLRSPLVKSLDFGQKNLLH